MKVSEFKKLCSEIAKLHEREAKLVREIGRQISKLAKDKKVGKLQFIARPKRRSTESAKDFQARRIKELELALKKSTPYLTDKQISMRKYHIGVVSGRRVPKRRNGVKMVQKPRTTNSQGGHSPNHVALVTH